MDDTRIYKRNEIRHTTLGNPAVQELIQAIVNDTMREKDRTVTIRIETDGAVSLNIYPTIN